VNESGTGFLGTAATPGTLPLMLTTEEEDKVLSYMKAKLVEEKENGKSGKWIKSHSCKNF